MNGFGGIDYGTAPKTAALNALRQQQHAFGSPNGQLQMGGGGGGMMNGVGGMLNGMAVSAQSRDGSQTTTSYAGGGGTGSFMQLSQFTPQAVDTSNLLGTVSPAAPTAAATGAPAAADTYRPHQSHYAPLGFGQPASNGFGFTGGQDALSGSSLGMPSFAHPQLASTSAAMYVPPSPSTSRKRPADQMSGADLALLNQANKRMQMDVPNGQGGSNNAVMNAILGGVGAPPIGFAQMNPQQQQQLQQQQLQQQQQHLAVSSIGMGLGNLAQHSQPQPQQNGFYQPNGLVNGTVNGMQQQQQQQQQQRPPQQAMVNGAGMMNGGMQGQLGYGIQGMQTNGQMQLTAQQHYVMMQQRRAQYQQQQQWLAANGAQMSQQQQQWQHYNPAAGRGYPMMHPQQQQPRFVDVAQMNMMRLQQQQREAAKQKAQKSAIYAKRQELKSGKGKGAGSETDEESDWEDAGRPRPKPKKRKIVDSDDDGDDFDNAGGFTAEVVHVPQEVLHARALHIFNTADETSLTELLNCSAEQAQRVLEFRPYANAEDFELKLKKVLTKGRGRGAAVPTRMFDECVEQLRGYFAVDSLVESCERTGAQLRAILDLWAQYNSASSSNGTASGTQTPDVERDSGVHLVAVAPDALAQRAAMKDYVSKQPALVPDEYQLKDYQILGLNWLNLLYSRKLSCILADEMGLGKTIQVISFFAHLKERGQLGPHLVVVPSSTLENWVREFDRFAPDIKVQTYYGGQKERQDLRETLLERDKPAGWEVLVTTYNLAQSSDQDRKFLRRIDWETCVFDEGHVLKNCQSQRYQNLMKIQSNWRLLLTGTPLQNNLQELVSLMCFILPDQFEPVMGSLRAIFKVKNEATNMLYRERTTRAKSMMKPFVLRRRKDQVLKDLPKKTERIEWCEMTETQSAHYNQVLQSSRKALLEQAANAEKLAAQQQPSAAASAAGTPAPDGTETPTGKRVRKKRELANLEMDAPPTPEQRVHKGGDRKLNGGGGDLSSNVLMDLRKAASHPALFRLQFDDGIVKKMAKACKADPQYKESNEAYIVEDMNIMTDAELQHFCHTHDCVEKFARPDEMFENSGKIQRLLKLLEGYFEEKRRVLIFSQFTQVLDILRAVLDIKQIKYLLLTGQTAVDTRLGLVDEFNQDEETPVFLLSTKAGGMGINLTAASVVILYDQDFNPHNDKQAADRAYRIGQKRDVDVIKLISKGTIEEDIMRLGETKLALDEAVAGETLGAGGPTNGAEMEDGEAGPAVESVAEKQIKASLLEAIKRQAPASPSMFTKTEEDADAELKTEFDQ